MSEDQRIVAVGLLTAADLDLLAPTYQRLSRVDETPCFADLLQAIDKADRSFLRIANVAPPEQAYRRA